MTSMKPTEREMALHPASAEELIQAEKDWRLAELRVVHIRLSRAHGPEVETLKMQQLRIERELGVLDAKLRFAKEHDVR